MTILFPFSAGSVVLFQGDSITDAGRSREHDADPGRGYVLMASALYSARYPESGATFLNRGLGGNTVKSLRDRWQADCLDLAPSVVSILIGINDNAMAKLENQSPTEAEFEAVYRELLKQTTERLGARLVLIEPFLLPNREQYELWRQDVNLRIGVVRRLAREFRAAYVPMDGLLAAACARADASFWSKDGIHLTAAGHALLAEAWLKAIGELRPLLS
ncbi:SGNH/GDSL hydrolase family protein [Paenibacillus cymbidii]|uniref:SGNH/GDSL hydrolase family protein n=1 Tax=Paenibacillus cymbidii TaxID=1639034 RepID=UPI00107FF602|nr:SGNH/GDSL hydrolase family protein [Paenibacillus cymbidii]